MEGRARPPAHLPQTAKETKEPRSRQRSTAMAATAWFSKMQDGSSVRLRPCMLAGKSMCHNPDNNVLKPYALQVAWCGEAQSGQQHACDPLATWCKLWGLPGPGPLRAAGLAVSVSPARHQEGAESNGAVLGEQPAPQFCASVHGSSICATGTPCVRGRLFHREMRGGHEGLIIRGSGRRFDFLATEEKQKQKKRVIGVWHRSIYRCVAPVLPPFSLFLSFSLHGPIASHCTADMK